MNQPFVSPIESDTILVPLDLTPLSQPTAWLAAQIAKAQNKKLRLLHLLPQGSSGNKTIENSKFHELRKLAIALVSKVGVCVELDLRHGSIYREIAEVAQDTHSGFMVMGTHGLQGTQKYLGSKALKVIRSADRPFLINDVRTPSNANFQRILIPVDARVECKQVLAWAKKLGALHHASFYLVSRETLGDGQNAVHNNLQYLYHHLSKAGLSVQQHPVFPAVRFTDALYHIAQRERIQLFMAVCPLETNLVETLQGGPLVQQLMLNPLGIPTLILQAFDGMVIVEPTTGLYSPLS